MADFVYEKKLWKKYLVIGGIDEVGRGAFAGPVVAGCVVFSKATKIPNDLVINDSKKLSEKQRAIASKWIKKNALCWGVGVGSVSKINKEGIVKATNFAFRKAIKSTQQRGGRPIEYLLIDAFYIPFIKGIRRKNQKAIIKGDSKSLSIAASSIIAKLYRDKLMTKLAMNAKYRKYLWHENKGYGTLKHRGAIKKHGPTRYHRSNWIRN